MPAIPATVASSRALPAIVDAADARARAGELVGRLRARAAKVDAERHIPPESIAEIAAAGLFRIQAPRAFGGSQLGIAALTEAVAAIASGCGSTGWVYAVLAGHNWLVSLFPEEAQREVFSDPSSLVASIVRLGGKPPQRAAGGYLFEGAAGRFCSGIEHATWVMVGAAVSDGGAPQARYFLIPKSEVEIIDDWFTAGLRGTRSCSLKIARAFVPEHRSVSIPEIANGTAPGIKLHNAPVYRAPFPQILPLPLSGVPIGLARAALEACSDGAKARMKGFVDEQIAEQSAFFARLSQADADIAAATALLLGQAGELDAVEEGTKLPELARARIVRNAGYSANQCRYAVTRLFEGSGGSAIYDSVDLQRIWRDANAAAAHNAFMRDKLDPAFGRAMLGLPPGKFDKIGH